MLAAFHIQDDVISAVHFIHYCYFTTNHFVALWLPQRAQVILYWALSAVHFIHYCYFTTNHFVALWLPQRAPGNTTYYLGPVFGVWEDLLNSIYAALRAGHFYDGRPSAVAFGNALGDL